MMEDGASAPAPQYPIESVDNALKVLLLLGEREELRLTEVSRYLGVASSTAHRILAMLQYRGFVRQDGQGGAYRPGAALTSVAFAILARFDFRGALRPYLERLNTETSETVHLGILDGSSVRFIDAIESPLPVRVASRLGRSLPATVTSSGKAILAELSTEDLYARYPRQELETLTEHSVRTRDELEAQLDGVRRRGYAMSIEESESGVSSVAVAVPARATQSRLAFNVSAPLNRMTPTARKTIGASLRAIAQEAAAVLPG